MNQGAKVSQEYFAPPKSCSAPVKPHLTTVQEAFGALGLKVLLRPLLTTFENLPFLGKFSGLWLPEIGSASSCLLSQPRGPSFDSFCHSLADLILLSPTPRKFRKDPRNAVKVLPGIPLESMAENPKPANSRHLKPPEHFQNSPPPPQHDWGLPGVLLWHF